jgi:hypothetical protein
MTASKPTSQDRSYKDSKYFIDDSVYNCPFCKRRHVKYYIRQSGSFDATHKSKLYFYTAVCMDCKKTSFHLSKHLINVTPLIEGKSILGAQEDWRKMQQISELIDTTQNQFVFPGELTKKLPDELDDCFVYNLPTSSFTLDERIPKDIRSPLVEAENCLKNNFLTGASACIRKAIYKLLQNHKIEERAPENKLVQYDKRIDLFAKKHPNIEADLIKQLKIVHAITSQEVHENDWEDLKAPSLRLLFAVIKEILTEIYVTPAERALKRKEIEELQRKADFNSKPNSKSSESKDER